MSASKDDDIPNVENLKIPSDSENSTNKSEDEEDEDFAADSSEEDFNYSEIKLTGFADPKILRLIEKAMPTIRKLLQRCADLLEQDANGNSEGLELLRTRFNEGKEEFRNFVQSFVNLLEEEKTSERKFSNLVEDFVAEDADSNRHLGFFMSIITDMKNEEGVTELLDALDSYT